MSRLLPNPQRSAGGIRQAPVGPDVLAFHRRLPGYRKTPLRSAPQAAAVLGVGRVLAKDESGRLEMPSFKILGASWAVYRLLCRRVGCELSEGTSLAELRSLLESDLPLELVAATDGNHGRAVAHMAQLLGLDAHILVPDDMAPARIEALRSEGARVSVIPGAYDDAVQASAELADETHLVVSDMSWPGYTEVPGWVMEGYGTIAFEIEAQLRDMELAPPTVVSLQIGVGALAAGMLAHLPGGVRVVGVEPTAAAGALASAEAGSLTAVQPPHDSIMSGLNCGEPSVLAWPLLADRVDAFVAVDDDQAELAMRLLARDGIVAGESGAAGLAGLLAFGPELELSGEDTVLTVITEGDTDPEAYAAIVSAQSSCRANSEDDPRRVRAAQLSGTHRRLS